MRRIRISGDGHAAPAKTAWTAGWTACRIARAIGLRLALGLSFSAFAVGQAPAQDGSGWKLRGAPALKVSAPTTGVEAGNVTSSGNGTGRNASGDAGGSVPVELRHPVAYRTSVRHSGRTTLLTFNMTAPVKARTFVLDNPRRVIVDLPEIYFQIDPAEGTAKKIAGQLRKQSGKRRGKSRSSLVKSFRFGLLGAGKSRVVVDLTGPARVEQATSRKLTRGIWQLEIVLAPDSAAAFAKATRAGSQTARASVPAPVRAKAKAKEAAKEAARSASAKPVIVIDPGHGGIDTGAIGHADAPEKDIVFAFSAELAKQLRSTGRYKVVMTREDDSFVSLAGRVQIAREARARLLISIHADSLNQGWVRGATVYTVSDRASDAHAARLAEKENRSDLLAGVKVPEASPGVSDILFDLARRETRAFSYLYARKLVESWAKAGRLNKNPHRSAGFRVLKAPDVPSVLLELGYLSSKRDAKLLTDPSWRKRTVKAMVKSVDRFFAGRGPLRNAQTGNGAGGGSPDGKADGKADTKADAKE